MQIYTTKSQNNIDKAQKYNILTTRINIDNIIGIIKEKYNEEYVIVYKEEIKFLDDDKIHLKY